MFIQREIWSFYTSVSHRVINLRTQSLLKETLNAVHLRELSAWWKSEHKKCRVEKIIIISLRLLRKALEKATREEFARLVLAVHTHHPPPTPAPVFLVCEYRLYPSPRGKMFLTSGLAEDSNFPLEQLSEIWSLGRHCFQTNGFRLICPKPIKENNAIVSKVDPLFLIRETFFPSNKDILQPVKTS